MTPDTAPGGKHRALTPRQWCKAGDHVWFELIHSGGGLCRSTCTTCGSLMLDTREAVDSEFVSSVQSRRGLWK